MNLKRYVTRFKHRYLRGVLILRYHRVAEIKSDPYSICVSPRFFAEHLEIVARYGYPLGLPGLVRSLWTGRLPRRAVVITFDDGYADNLYEAKPMLERYGMPATVFVTTGSLDGKREFWCDRLERLLFQAGRVPETLSANIGGRQYQWDLERSAQAAEADRPRHRRRQISSQKEPTPRHHALWALHHQLKALPDSERVRILDELEGAAGVEPSVRSTHRPLTSDEVVRLKEGNLVEVGSHSVTHPVLTKLSAGEQRSEITGSKKSLEDLLACPVTAFSYPYGVESDATRLLVQDAGFVCACAGEADVAGQWSDPFRLPRIPVGNWDGNEFERQLGLGR